MHNLGLVLEGGGMRGQFTAGALDFFLDRGIDFDYVIGVSAGACNGTSYISRQRGRNKIVNTAFVKDWRFVSFRSLIVRGSLFGMDFIFDAIPNKLVPFDTETFLKSRVTFKVVTTDCATGRAAYYEKADFDSKFSVLRASCSMPLLSPMVEFRGRKLLDGGIADPVPIRKAVADGFIKNVVILTRNRGYKKNPVKLSEELLYRARYHKYPALIKTILQRPDIYNETLDYLDELERRGQAVVIRPTAKLKVGRLEKNIDRLMELYKQGYRDAAAAWEKIKALTVFPQGAPS